MSSETPFAGFTHTQATRPELETTFSFATYRTRLVIIIYVLDDHPLAVMSGGIVLLIIINFRDFYLLAAVSALDGLGLLN